MLGPNANVYGMQNICDIIISAERPQELVTDTFYGQQIERYDEALVSMPDDIELLTLRGDSYFALDAFDEAIADFLRATEIDTTNTYAYARLGDAYQRVFEIEAAIEAYTQAIEIDEAYAYAHLKRGVAYKKLAETAELDPGSIVYERALDDLNTAIRLDPTSALAFARRAEVYLSLRNSRLALADAENAVNIGSFLAFSHVVLASVHKAQGNFNDAFASIRTGLNTPSENAEVYAYAYTMAGEMCWRIDQREQALQLLDVALAYDGQFAPTYIVFARTTIDTRRETEQRIAQQIEDTFSAGLAQYVVTFANWALQLAPQWPTAGHYQSAVTSNPVNPFVHRQLATLPVASIVYADSIDVYSQWLDYAASLETTEETTTTAVPSDASLLW